MPPNTGSCSRMRTATTIAAVVMSRSSTRAVDRDQAQDAAARGRGDADARIGEKRHVIPVLRTVGPMRIISWRRCLDPGSLLPRSAQTREARRRETTGPDIRA